MGCLSLEFSLAHCLSFSFVLSLLLSVAFLLPFVEEEQVMSRLPVPELLFIFSYTTQKITVSDTCVVF